MKKEEFLELLEAFPGKEELMKGAPNPPDYRKHDFLEIAKDIKRSRMRIRLDLGKDEDLWCKLLSFLEIANWFILGWDDSLAIREEYVMTKKSLRIGKELIVPKYNEFLKENSKKKIYGNFQPCITMQGMLMEELTKLFQSGRSLF